MNPMISMMEVQPQLSRSFRSQRVTPVRFGRSQTPVLALVPWAHYVSWRDALASMIQVEETCRSVGETGDLCLSYRSRLAPLLSPVNEKLRTVVVVTHGRKDPDRYVGAIVRWQDWQQGEGESQPAEQDSIPRILTTVAASKHFAEFAREALRGTFQPVTVVTQRDVPILVILPAQRTEVQEEESVHLLIKRIQTARALWQSSIAHEMLNPALREVTCQALEHFLDFQRQKLGQKRLD